MNMEPQWNDGEKEKPKYSEKKKTCPNATSSTTNTSWTGLYGRQRGIYSEWFDFPCRYHSTIAPYSTFNSSTLQCDITLPADTLIMEHTTPLTSLSQQRNTLSVYFLRKCKKRAEMDELVDKDKLLKKGQPKQLTIWTSIWEMSCSNLGQSTRFPSWFSSLALHNVRIISSLDQERFAIHPFKFIAQKSLHHQR